MITLKTLHLATEQEVFDQVPTHLLKQGVKSLDPIGSCRYREGNLMCAAGCLIAEDEYSEEMEGYNWGKEEIFPDTHRSLIKSLQDVHDRTPTEDWKLGLSRVARVYGLHEINTNNS